MATPRPHARRPIDVAADHPWWTILAVLCIAIIVLVLLWDWNWFKGPIERQVEARTGRSLDIGGNLDVDLGRTTIISAEGLRFANAEWSQADDMATADRLELHVRPLEMLRHRRLEVAELRLAKPDILLETGDEGGNWDFGMEGGDGGGPVFQRLWIDDGRLRYLDPKGKTDIDVAVASRGGDARLASPPLGVDGKGHWRGAPFTLEGTAESPLELVGGEAPYSIDLRAAAGTTRARARGQLVDPFKLQTFDLQFALSGRDMEELFPLLGIAMPPSPPYALDGRLRREGATWHYDGFSGEVGESDLGGSVTIETGGGKLFLKADLRSKLLDFDDLGGFVGAPPERDGGEKTNAELAAAQREQESRGRILPDHPYDLRKLNAMNADVRWKAARIEAPGLPLDAMDAHLKLDDGIVLLDPLNFGAAGGEIRSNIRMDARRDVIQTRADITAKGLELGRLFPDGALANEAVGRVGGTIDVNGTGNSIARMLGTADGDISIGMGAGSVSNLLMELAGIDIYEAVKFLIGKDRKVQVRCAFGDFAVEDGLMTARALAFDTSDTIIVGKGTISLGEESLDLELRPRPKDRSILSLRSPLVIGGTFADPSFRPDMARLGLRGALALALGSIAPPAALLATIELGGGEDSGCGGEYAK